MENVIKCIRRTWDAIAFDIPQDTVTSEELIELCVDADRHRMYGHDPAASNQIDAMIAADGYDKFVRAVCAALPYEQWEAGGAQ